MPPRFSWDIFCLIFSGLVWHACNTYLKLSLHLIPHPWTDGYFLLRVVTGRAAKENKVQTVRNEAAAEAGVQQKWRRAKPCPFKKGGEQENPGTRMVKRSELHGTALAWALSQLFHCVLTPPISAQGYVEAHLMFFVRRDSKPPSPLTVPTTTRFVCSSDKRRQQSWRLVSAQVLWLATWRRPGSTSQPLLDPKLAPTQTFSLGVVKWVGLYAE